MTSPDERTATDFPEGLGPAHRGRRLPSAGPFTWRIQDASAQAASYPDPDFRQLDSWIVIHEDNTATFCVGKTDLRSGHRHGVPSDDGRRARHALRARPPASWAAPTSRVDQGGRGIRRDPDRRLADAPCRRGGPTRTARAGVDNAGRASGSACGLQRRGHGESDPSKRVTDGELVGGKRFNVALTGNNVDGTTGTGKVKPVQDLKIAGQSPQRYDIPAKVDGSLKWAVDIKVPGWCTRAT